MYYSLRFVSGSISKNTWTDWHLIPSERPYVDSPEVREKMVEIPGRSGLLDMTEMLTGDIHYGNRTGSWTFYVMHEYWSSWKNAYNAILVFLHGKRMKVYLEDDPNYYYIGRFKVKWSPQKDYSKITIEYNLDPFRVNESTGNKVL